jgi:hypothetical protein
LRHAEPTSLLVRGAAPQVIASIPSLRGGEAGIDRRQIVWVKDVSWCGRSDYHYRHEFIFYGWVPRRPAHSPVEDRTQDTVWEIPRPKTFDPDHPTMKPVELVARSLRNSTERGAIVADAFGGSGPTLSRRTPTGRLARLVELDPPTAT